VVLGYGGGEGEGSKGDNDMEKERMLSSKIQHSFSGTINLTIKVSVVYMARDV
jgi:hypothetical protein